MFVTARPTTIKTLHGFYIPGIEAQLPQLQKLLLRHRHTSVIPATQLKLHAKNILQLLPTHVKYMHAMDIAARCMGYHGWSEAINSSTINERGMEVISSANDDLMATDTEYLQRRDIASLFNTALTDIPFDFTLLKQTDKLLDGYGWDQTLKAFEESLAIYTLPVNYTLLRSQVRAYLTWLCKDLMEYSTYSYRVSKHPFIVKDELIK